MALIKCPECGASISDQAPQCPRCGWVNPFLKNARDKRKLYMMLLLSAVGVLIIVGAACLMLFFWDSKTPTDTASAPAMVIQETAAADKPKETPKEEVSSNKPQLLKVVSVSYWGNSLANQGSNSYQPMNLIDGNPATSWSISLDNEGVYDCDMIPGPVFTLEGVELSYIVIWNGYCKSAASFKNNSRPSKIMIYNQAYLDRDGCGMPSEYLYNGRLKDTSSPQMLKIPADLRSNNNITKIAFDFDTPYNGGVIRGDKWNDFCISEVEFWGKKL